MSLPPDANVDVAASALPSPPGAKTPSSSAIHPFFTPRRRIFSTIGSNSQSRVHLLSPEESPSQRSSKRARLDPSTKDVPPTPSRRRDAFEQKMEEEEEKIVLPGPYKHIRPSTQHLLLQRSLGAFPLGDRRRAFHCADWSIEVLRFYSRPEDLHVIEEEAPCLPFSTSASNRSSLIAIGDESGMVRLVESAKDEEPGFIYPYITFQCHDNAIFDLSWSPDDLTLASASGDQTIRIFDVTKQQPLYILRHHYNSVKTVSFSSANPSILCSSGRDGSFNIWDLRVSGTKTSEGPDIVTVLQPVLPVRGAHTSSRKANSVTAAVWLDEQRIATACEFDAVIKTWDLRNSKIRRKKPQPIDASALPPRHSLPGHRNFGINSLTVSPDGQRIYAVCKDSHVYAYATHHLENGPMHAYSHPRFHAETFYVKAGISRDGKFLATGSSDGVACVFPTEERYFDKRISATFNNRKHALSEYLNVGSGVALVRGHDREVTDVAWTVHGDLVTICDNYTARCWRQGETGEEAESLREGGEDGGRRWGWGWADKTGREKTGDKPEA